MICKQQSKIVPRKKIPASTSRLVRQRAKYLCEYCHTSEQWQYVTFTVDHIVPLASSGGDENNNLALACFYCNRRKGSSETAVDPDSSEQVSLFHPRHDQWQEHFIWSIDGEQIIGITPTGRATVSLLNFNRKRILQIRAADTSVGRHPPSGDPIAST